MSPLPAPPAAANHGFTGLIVPFVVGAGTHHRAVNTTRSYRLVRSETTHKDQGVPISAHTTAVSRNQRISIIIDQCTVETTKNGEEQAIVQKGTTQHDHVPMYKIYGSERPARLEHSSPAPSSHPIPGPKKQILANQTRMHCPAATYGTRMVYVCHTVTSLVVNA